MEPITNKIVSRNINNQVLNWDNLFPGTIPNGTRYITSNISALISGNNRLTPAECFSGSAVNFMRRESMIRSDWQLSGDQFSNAITLELNPIVQNRGIRSIGVQYAVDDRNDFSFNAFLRVTDQNGRSYIFENPDEEKGITHRGMDGSAVLLGARAEAREIIQKVELTVVPLSASTINGFYINSLRFSFT